jgi:mRNA interferase YafQ
MYKIETTNKFDKDYILIFKRKYDLSLIQKVVEILETEGKLPLKYKPHKLSGNYADNWECHIKADRLLIWII